MTTRVAWRVVDDDTLRGTGVLCFELRVVSRSIS